MLRMIFPGFYDARVGIHAALTGIVAWWAFVFSCRRDALLIPSFRAFREVNASEDVWAICLTIVAVIGFYGLIARKRWAAMASAFVLSVAHATIGLLFLSVSDYHLGSVNTAQGNYLVLGMLGIYLCWRRLFD